MHRYRFSYVLIVLSIICLLYRDQINTSFASFSPSFVNQQIVDPANDIVSFGLDPLGHNYHCKLNRTDLLDMSGVTYESNGKTLNSTIWLNNAFTPHILNQSLSKKGEEKVDIYPSYPNNTLINIAEGQNTNVKNYLNDFLENNHQSHRQIYDSNNKSSELYVYSIQKPYKRYGFKIISDVNYGLTKITTYESNENESISKITNETKKQNLESYIFKNESKFFNDTSNYNPTDYKKYKQYGIVNKVTFNILPIKGNYTINHWISSLFSMQLDIISVYHSGPAVIDDVEWKNSTKAWKEITYDISPQKPQELKPIKTREIRNASAFFKNGTVIQHGYVDLGVDLGLLNYPTDYRILFQTTNEFEASNGTGYGITCFLNDISDLVVVPPPIIQLTVVPSSLTLQSGQSKVIQVFANSSTDLDSFVSFSYQNISGLKLQFSPPQLSLSPHGIASSNLLISSLPNQSASDTLHIIAKITFPISLSTTMTSYRLSNTNLTGIILHAYPFLSVIPPKPPLEQISDIFNTVHSTLQNIIGLITIIGGPTTILALVTVFMKKKSNQQQKGEKQQGAPF